MWTTFVYGAAGAMLGPFIVEWAYRLIQKHPYGFLPSATPTRSFYVVAAFVAAIAFTTMIVRWNGSPFAVAFSWFAATGIALAAVDIDFHRLPHHLVAATAVGGCVLLAVADPVGLSRGMVAALATAGCCALAMVLFGDGLGFGDVTLFGTAALYLGWLGWRYLVLALVLTTLLAAAFAIFLLVTRRGGWKYQFAYGPLLIFSTLLVLVAP